MSCSVNQTQTSGAANHTRHPVVRWLQRHRLLIGGITIGCLGLAFGWNWLAAIGALPILFSTLPCLIMIGVCMKSMKSCSKNEQTAEMKDVNAPSNSVLLSAPSPRLIEGKNHA